MSKIKININNVCISIEIWKTGSQYGYQLLRNGKVQKISVYPKENRNDIKMDIVHNLEEYAFYEFRHLLDKTKIK